MRAGVSWIGGVDGTAGMRACMENLCERPVFTGYSVDGGYAEYVAVRADFHSVPRASMLSTSLPCCARGLLGFAACGSPAFSAGNGWGSSATEVRRR